MARHKLPAIDAHEQNAIQTLKPAAIYAARLTLFNTIPSMQVRHCAEMLAGLALGFALGQLAVRRTR
jgi:hypothetical protein